MSQSFESRFDDVCGGPSERGSMRRTVEPGSETKSPSQKVAFRLVIALSVVIALVGAACSSSDTAPTPTPTPTESGAVGDLVKEVSGYQLVDNVDIAAEGFWTIETDGTRVAGLHILEFKPDAPHRDAIEGLFTSEHTGPRGGASTAVDVDGTMWYLHENPDAAWAHIDRVDGDKIVGVHSDSNPDDLQAIAAAYDRSNPATVATATPSPTETAAPTATPTAASGDETTELAKPTIEGYDLVDPTNIEAWELRSVETDAGTYVANVRALQFFPDSQVEAALKDRLGLGSDASAVSPTPTDATANPTPTDDAGRETVTYNDIEWDVRGGADMVGFVTFGADSNVLTAVNGSAADRAEIEKYVDAYSGQL